MDDQDKNAVGGGAAGVAIGYAVGGPPGAIVGGIGGLLWGGHEKKHNKALRNTYYNLYELTHGEPTIHVDHIKPDGATVGGTRGVITQVNGAPDLIMQAPGLTYPNLVIEVETIEGIKNDERHTIEQLNDFQTQGYKRVLVTPSSQKADVYEWCEAREQDGSIKREVSISTPDGIGAVL